jgi:hypothetical protein
LARPLFDFPRLTGSAHLGPCVRFGGAGAFFLFFVFGNFSAISPGRKIMLRTIAALALSLTAGVAFASDTATRARDALELFYIANKAYSPVVCRTAEQNDRDFILCNQPLMDSGVGALWAAADDGKLIPVNGKARSQFKRFGPEINGVDGKPVDVVTWQEVFPGQNPDIASALTLFQ